MSRHRKAVRFVSLLAKRLIEEGKEPRTSVDKRAILKAAVCSLPPGKLKKQLQKYCPIYCRKFQRCLKEAREQCGMGRKFSRATPDSPHNLYTMGGSLQDIQSGMQLSATRLKHQQSASNLMAVTYNASKYKDITELQRWWKKAMTKRDKGSDAVELCRRESTFLYHCNDVGSLHRLMKHSLQRLSRDAYRILQSGDTQRASELGRHIFNLLLYFHFKSDLMQSGVESIKEGDVYRSHMTALLSIYISLNALVARKGGDVEQISKHLLSRISLLVDGDGALMDVVLQLRNPAQGDPDFLLPVLRHVIQTRSSPWTPTSYLKYMCLCRIARSVLRSTHAEELAALIQVMLGVSPPEDIGAWLTDHCPDLMQRIPQEAVPGQLTNYLLQVASHELLDQLQELVTSQPSTIWDTGTWSESSESDPDDEDNEAPIVVASDKEDSDEVILHQEQMDRQASLSYASRSSPDDVLCLDEVPHPQTVKNKPDDVEVVDNPADHRDQLQGGEDAPLEIEDDVAVFAKEGADIMSGISPNPIPDDVTGPSNVSPCLNPDDVDPVLTVREEESDDAESEDAENQRANDARGVAPPEDHFAMVDDIAMEMTFNQGEVNVVQRRSPRLASKKGSQESMSQENQPEDLTSPSMNSGKNDVQNGVVESFRRGTPNLRRSPRKQVRGAASEGRGTETSSKERESVIHGRRRSPRGGVITRSRVASWSDNVLINTGQETTDPGEGNMARGHTLCAETDEDLSEHSHRAENANISKFAHTNDRRMSNGGSPPRESAAAKEDDGKPLEKSGTVQASNDHSTETIIPDSEDEQPSDTRPSVMVLRRLRNLDSLKSLTSSPVPNTAMDNILNNSPSMSTRSRCQEAQSCIYDSNPDLSPGKQRRQTPASSDKKTPSASPEIHRNAFTKDYTAVLVQTQAVRTSPRSLQFRRKMFGADKQATHCSSNDCTNSEAGTKEDGNPSHSPVKPSVPDRLPNKATSHHAEESVLRRSPRRSGVFNESHSRYAASPPLGTNMQRRARSGTGSPMKGRANVRRMLDFNGDCVGSSDARDAESFPQIVRLSARKRKRLSK